MVPKKSLFNSKTKEVFFQVVLHIVLFLFYSFDQNEPYIQEFKVFAFLNYAAGAFIINYVLLPRLFYRKEYYKFFFTVALVVAAIIIVEEFVLEKIYFPDTKGARFPGVIFSLLDVMPVITILAGFKFAWDASRKQLEVEELQLSVKESELQYLKSQINPHFLFNNLNNLYSYAIEQSPKTPSIILELSSVLRYMLYDCKEKFVALEKEIEHLKNFTKLNEMQVEERGRVSFTTENITPGYEIAPLILTVFVENAFKHSTASQSKDIHIDIAIVISEKGELRFTCKNSFQPLGNTESLSKGIGLQNVRKRLQILYPDAHELIINEGIDLYSVFLTIQLNPKV